MMRWWDRARSWASLACGAGLSLVACSGEANVCGGGECDVRVATWWASRGEYAPFGILERSLLATSPFEAVLAHRDVTKVDHTHWIEQQLDPETAAPERVDVFSANN